MPIEFRPKESPRSFGYHFLVGLQPSPRLTEHDKRLLDAVGPAGVVLFRDNFEQSAPYDQWLGSLRQLLQDAREYIGRREIFVCIDHEGGRVHRPPAPITQLPPAGEWKERVGVMARAMGTELRSLGVNIDFAPVADVATKGGTEAIGNRAFGSCVNDVSDAVGTVVRVLAEEGVWACPKHYPGHGATTADSHLELPYLNTTLEDLRRGHLQPFAAAVKAGAHCIMSAHIHFPNIDPIQPSTMSSILLQRLLRRELGFQGLLVTDDLGMHAVSEIFKDDEAVIKTLSASTDLLMVCAHWTDTNRVLSMSEGIIHSLHSGRLVEEALTESFERVRTALESVPQHSVTFLSDSIRDEHQAFSWRQETKNGGLLDQEGAVTADPTARHENW